MLRFLFIIIFAYLMFRAIRGLIAAVFYRPGKKEDAKTQDFQAPEKKKIIPEDEGEYVDFEEVD